MNQVQLSSLAELYAVYKDHIRLGSLSISRDNYPFSAFLIGFFIGRVNTDFERTFQFVELLDSLEQMRIVSLNQIKQILQLLADFPRYIAKMLTVLDDLKNGQLRDIDSWIESYEISKYLDLQDDQMEKNEEQKLIPNLNIAQNEDIEIQPMEATIEENKEQINEQDIALAMRMQQELDKEKQFYGQVDDTVCQICCTGLYQSQFLAMDKCQHIFHNNCLIGLIKTNILNNNFPIRCPKDGCDRNISEFDIKSLLSEELFQKYQDHTLKSYAEVHGDSISWCPTPSCGYMFFYEKDDGSYFRCLECNKAYCLNCRADWHEFQTCKEYSITSTFSEEDNKFMNYVKGKKYKQCPQCKFWVSKNHGCNHMTCKCKFQFCYKCGGVYQRCECIEKNKINVENRQQRLEEKRLRKLEIQRIIASKLSQPKLSSQQSNQKE